jgi:hypothetical protein
LPLDTVAEIRELAKNWRNCLAGYLFSGNDGTSVIYLSEQLEAVCSVGRHGRMGWLLVQTKGPRNADIDPNQLAQIHAAFADAGIPQSSMIEAIKSILQTHEWSRHHQGLNDDEIFDDMTVATMNGNNFGKFAQKGFDGGLYATPLKTAVDFKRGHYLDRRLEKGRKS